MPRGRIRVDRRPNREWPRRPRTPGAGWSRRGTTHDGRMSDIAGAARGLPWAAWQRPETSRTASPSACSVTRAWCATCSAPSCPPSGRRPWTSTACASFRPNSSTRRATSVSATCSCSPVPRAVWAARPARAARTGTAGGGPTLVMVEHQSAPVPRMAARMMTQTGMLYESLAPRARDAGGRFPPLLALVVYTGDAQWRAATDLAELAGAPGDVGAMAELAGRRYVVLDSRRLAREDLPEHNRMTVFVRLTFLASGVRGVGGAGGGAGVAGPRGRGGALTVPVLRRLARCAGAGAPATGIGTRRRRDEWRS